MGLTTVELFAVSGRHRDLHIQRSGLPETTFEIKISWDIDSVYSAIWQLFFYRPRQSDRLVAVFPDNGSDTFVAQRFSNLGIGLVLYRLEDGRVTFAGLESALG